MSEALARIDGPLTAIEIKAHVQIIQQVMAAVMKPNVHYGIIPGCKKPSLWKAGSEVILTTFGIAAYPKEVDDLSTGDEIRYRVKVHGISINSGLLVGVGIGECSSNEEKYKWRKPVCDGEYDDTAEDRRREVWKKEYGTVKKIKQVRTSPSDAANTILKMAKKRGQIDLTLTATAASDQFDQGLEDLPPEIIEGIIQEQAQQKPPLTEPKARPASAPSANDGKPVISEPQRIRFVTIARKAGKSDDTIKEYCRSMGFEHSADITRDKYDTMCEWAAAK